MITPVSYDTTMAISNSWDAVRNDPNWEDSFGTKMIRRSLELDPFAVAVFLPFGTKGDKMYESPQFKASARECASTLDFIVCSLGPDMDMLFSQLMEMGNEAGLFAKIRPEHWRVLEQSMMSALEQTLGDKFDANTRASWERVFDAVSSAIIKVIRPSRRRSIN
ncbi:hypothetical protein MPSEU_000065200 [Mayamaea pseudoterrestris]|nr:hypothetical protein MPSEU_000064000 [Mayamaea pseudoterrestris]GKY90924.1 hypothetical protein MPSEU_000065200 [Mayamaea pseudoterrestris]